MEKWFVAAKKADFDAWSRKFHISPVTARIIRNRDIFSEEEVEKYLNGTFLDLYPPELMLDMEDAAAILEAEIRSGGRIRVIGDYDVDGIAAAHILTKGLRELSAEVDTVIPHRIRDGYGLNEQLIEDAHAEGIHTIVTCDNGIAAAGQVALAVSYGMTVVVTDHHEVPFREEDGTREELLPPAAAVVDPKRAECTYPFRNICGAVVAYKLVELLLRRAGMNPGKKQALLDEFLQLAAVATVCDVMELLDENRILVKEGLKLLNRTPCRGMRALMQVNGVEPQALSAYHLGFVLGPCLNATGRLDTAKRALELLDAESERAAYTIACELKEMNDSRKSMTLSGVEQAIQQVEAEHETRDKVLVIFLPECHESLAGIIAGRIRERYNRPVFVLTRGEDGIKGSGRSIEAYHMYEAMRACGELFTKYGGHKLAAGLSMREENIPLLKMRLNENCTLTEEDFLPRLLIDVPMPLSYATRALAEELSVLEPFGTGNPKPLFATKNVIFRRGFRFGTDGKYARYRVEQDGCFYELLYFGGLDRFHGFLRERFGTEAEEMLYRTDCQYSMAVAYELGMHTYRGSSQVQLVMKSFT